VSCIAVEFNTSINININEIFIHDMTFKQQYTVGDFLTVIDCENMRLTPRIAELVGCSTGRAQYYLELLEKSNKVKKIKIEGAKNRTFVAWLKVC